MSKAKVRAGEVLALLINNYLNDEENIIEHLPRVLEAIIFSNLFNVSNEDDDNKLAQFGGIPTFSSAGAKGKSKKTADSLTNVDNQNKYEESVRKWTSKMVALVLSKNDDCKLAGTMLMKQTIEQSSTLLATTFEKWTFHLLAMLTKSESQRVQEAAIMTIKCMLEFSKRSTSISNDVVVGVVEKYNVQLVKLLSPQRKLFGIICDTLIWSAKSYPTTIKNNGDKCVKACLEYLDGKFTVSRPELVKTASETVASLVSTYTGKKSSADTWEECIEKTINSITDTLNKLFFSIYGNEKKHRINFDKFEMKECSDDYVVKIPQMLDRCVALAQLLVALLTTETQDAVVVPVERILHLVDKIIGVTSSSKKHQLAESQEYLLLQANLSQLYYVAVRIISSLVVSTENYLLPYLKHVTLACVKLNLLANRGELALVEIYSYNVITLLCEYHGYGAACYLDESFYLRLVKKISLNFDASDVHGQNSLSATAEQTKSKSTKRQRSQKKGTEINTNATAKRLTWSDAHYSTLMLLKTLLLKAPDVLSVQLRLRFEHIVISTLLISESCELVCTSNLHSKSIILYYECLLALVQRPRSNKPSVVPHALRLFTKGLNIPQAKSICTEGLTICELLLHPRLPPLIHNAAMELSSDSDLESIDVDADITSINENFDGITETHGNRFEPQIVRPEAGSATTKLSPKSPQKPLTTFVLGLQDKLHMATDTPASTRLPKDDSLLSGAKFISPNNSTVTSRSFDQFVNKASPKKGEGRNSDNNNDVGMGMDGDGDGDDFDLPEIDFEDSD
ncbi:Pre-rRNA-processing protein rix1 [Zancudomyces culisetae]|uniref:Pre-rRNA-processing protein RIX1 n=1 Tax=Zancudomyces culisetae TaxID=1213189 RepID=A0A1R1PVD0_ZANCU|nr:Pre-rRNA-processing protein rix1 [Zancudomyces culisetae]|eukprot:OMH84926.1 Pre-rRNA-processing protein rix1 [Zancudomyces culisetae]